MANAKAFRTKEDLSEIYNFEVESIDGTKYKLEKYKGSVLLIVNVASKCKLAEKSYKNLQELTGAYHNKGLRILLFPCGQFLNQEHDELEKIKNFASEYSQNFILMNKVKVNGKDTHPLFEYLKSQLTGFLTNDIKWNFTYFLIDRDGTPLKRYSPNDLLDLKDETLLKSLELNRSTSNYAL